MLVLSRRDLINISECQSIQWNLKIKSCIKDNIVKYTHILCFTNSKLLQVLVIKYQQLLKHKEYYLKYFVSQDVWNREKPHKTYNNYIFHWFMSKTTMNDDTIGANPL